MLCESVPFIKNIWMKKKPHHSRSRWIAKILRDKFIDGNTAEVIVRVMIDKSLNNGRNLSRYEYYIIRILSRRPELSKLGYEERFKDLKIGRT